MKSNGENTIEKTTLLNDSFRKLILNSRTYASFTNDELDFIFKNCRDAKEIFDPMSGYGGLMRHCIPLGIGTFNVEVNPPAYLWQVLTNPSNSLNYLKLIDDILSDKRKWPRISSRAIVTDTWFPAEGLSHLKKILDFIVYRNQDNKLESSLALLIPFVARFSTCVMGDVTHIKKGGICVFNGWGDDFSQYLLALRAHQILPLTQYASKNNHKTFLGDIRSFQNNKKNFELVITSPPYPNYRDYGKMFLPENLFINEVAAFPADKSTHIIGSNIVKNKKEYKIKSKIANDFLKKLSNFKGTKKAEDDIRSYYLPYFSNYFSDIEQAIISITKMLSSHAEVYFIVVNNTTRTFVVPVAGVILECFVNNGMRSEILDTFEQFHYGTKNPHSKGLKSKHSKYFIKAWTK